MTDDKNAALNCQVIQQESLAREIDDLLDENPVDEFSESIKDVDAMLERLENLRNKYRRLNLEIISEAPPEASTDSINKVTSITMEAIKTYIKSAKQFRKSIRDRESKEKSTQKELMERSLEFELSNTLKFVKDIEIDINVLVTSCSDDELERRANGIPEVKRRYEKLTNKIAELLIQPVDESNLDELKQRYEKLQHPMHTYFCKIDRERENRELGKQKLFKESNLNISFQNLKSTPLHLTFFHSKMILKNCILEPHRNICYQIF